MEMINQGHFQRTGIKDRLDELHELWELLLKKLSEKGLKLQQVSNFQFHEKISYFTYHSGSENRKRSKKNKKKCNIKNS